MQFSSLDPVRGKGARIANIELGTGLNAGDSGAASWSVSPDGSGLAVVDAQPHIEVFSQQDRAWREIRVDPVWGILSSINWTVDGVGFYAISRLAGARSFNLLHVTGSGRVEPLLGQVKNQQLTGLAASPNGRHLAFTVEARDSNVWMIEGF